MKMGAELIADERKRQIDVEGWSKTHGAAHPKGDLALAGCAYVLDAVAEYSGALAQRKDLFRCHAQLFWPSAWLGEYWKPTPNDPVRQLVKAGALIAAEIDKLQSEAQR